MLYELYSQFNNIKLVLGKGYHETTVIHLLRA